MNRTQKFLRSSLIAQRDAKYVMENIQRMIQWKDNCTVLDIGCGPGNNTHGVLLPNIPKLKNLVGVDKLGDMIQYANERYGKEFYMTFKEMDIANFNVAQSNYEKYFDHVFSFYCLHFIAEQELALRNIYMIMKPGGDFFFSCSVHANYFQILAFLANKPMWKEYMTNFNKFICPYEFSTDIEEDIKCILHNVGFKVSHLSIEPKHMLLPLDIFTDLFVSHLPFELPKDVANSNEFNMSCLDAVKKLKFYYIENEKEFFCAKYQMLLAHVTKAV